MDDKTCAQVVADAEQRVRAEVLEKLQHVACQFWACPGPDVEPVDMATCHVCWLIHDLNAAQVGQ